MVFEFQVSCGVSNHLFFNKKRLGKSVLEAICRGLAMSIKGFLIDDEYIEIMANDENSVAREVTEVVKPFYVQKKSWFNRLTG